MMNTNSNDALKVFKTNGQYNIEQIHYHELKMDSLLKKWKNTEHNVNTSFRLPGVHPSPYLKAIPKTNENISLKSNTNHVTSEIEKEVSTGKMPVIRALNFSNEEYTNFVDTYKMTTTDYQTPRSYTKKTKRLGLSESSQKKINATLEANVFRYKVPAAIKFEREVSIIKRKMKMNQISKKKLDEMRVTIEELSKESAPKNSQVDFDSINEASEPEYIPVEEPSEYLNIISHVEPKKINLNKNRGLLSFSETPDYYEKLEDFQRMTKESKLRLHSSLKKFSANNELDDINISKRTLQNTNKKLDITTLDSYYDLIKDRDLRLIDELNLKYSKIKFDA